MPFAIPRTLALCLLLAALAVTAHAADEVAPIADATSDFLQEVSAKADGISSLLLAKDPTNKWVPSKVYKVQDMLDAIKPMVETGISGMKFYDGSDASNTKYGLVNLAAFLAQSMKETIMYDACDENNWSTQAATGYDPTTKQAQDYPLSAACGQLGQSYQDYGKDDPDACPLDPNMRIVAVTNAEWYGAPGPLFCAPKTDVPFTGYWDIGGWCAAPLNAKPLTYDTLLNELSGKSTCKAYVGQKAGTYAQDHAVQNCNPADATCTTPRSDVENCCWWGRGIIQTSGRGNFGKLNKFIGAGAGKSALFPDVDFCKDPEAVCKSDHPDLKWIAGFFYWMQTVQKYEDSNFNYLSALKKFVDGGMSDNNAFIDAVSGIVNRGCASPPCAGGTGPTDGLADREANFANALKAMAL